MDGNKGLTAIGHLTHTLHIQVIGSGTVAVSTANESDIVEENEATGYYRIVRGAEVTLTANPAQGQNFLFWRGGLWISGQNPLVFNMNRPIWVWARFTGSSKPYVQITEAVVDGDSIEVQLGPGGNTGELTIELRGPSGTHIVHYDEEANAGTVNVPFIESLDEEVGSVFTMVRATWTVDSTNYYDETHLDYSFKVLGLYNHTCYNLPIEEECDQSSHQWFSHTTGTCEIVSSCDSQAWTDKQASAAWIEAITHPDWGTGSGQMNGHIYTREQYCSGASANYDTIFRQVSDGPCGSCDPIEIGDVAIRYPQHDYLVCNDVVYVHRSDENENGTFHTVRDTGDFPQEHLDHYTGPSPCGVCDEPSENDEMVLKIL